MSAMGDRQLLEDAARAAGHTVSQPHPGGGLWVPGRPNGADRVLWNPLTDDGDALRLAVKIGMEFAVDDDATHNNFVYARVRGTGDSHIFEPVVDDPCKALRRCIVRAAAAIGAAMKGEGK